MFSKWEIIFYNITMIGLNILFYYQVHLCSKHLVEFYGGSKYLVNGWSSLGRLRDGGDLEWETWLGMISIGVPWLLTHLIISYFIRKFDARFVPIVNTVISLLFSISQLGLTVSVIRAAEVIIFFSVTKWHQSKFTVWLSAGVIYFMHLKVESMFVFLSKFSTFLNSISRSWTMLKLIDYSLNELDKPTSLKGFVELCGYVFYLPTYFYGPFIPYQDFYPGLYTCYSLTNERFKSLILPLIKYGFYTILLNLSYHFFYFNILLEFINFPFLSDPLNMYCLVFCMAQMFYLKYLITYGSLGCIARFEGYQAPPPPKCVSRIHLYSNMWRYFDRGYYLFMTKNIYLPVLTFMTKASEGKSYCKDEKDNTVTATIAPDLIHKLVSSSICFVFVYLWHGITSDIFYWSLFNFLGLSLEACGRVLCQTKSYEDFTNLAGSEGCLRRLTCIIQTPLWILAMISNSFFFCGGVLGFRCLFSLFTNGWMFIFFVFSIGYIVCQVSETWKNSLTVEKIKQK